MKNKVTKYLVSWRISKSPAPAQSIVVVVDEGGDAEKEIRRAAKQAAIMQGNTVQSKNDLTFTYGQFMPKLETVKQTEKTSESKKTGK